ncbi:YadA-like family protein, partial [Pectobacterium parmentieri]
GYADGKASEALNTANGYADGKASEALNTANGYADGKASEALNTANGYADGKASEALNTANNYTDSKVSATLRSANAYTDKSINRLERKVNRGLASTAALSGLFQPYGVGKFNFSAGVGGYRDESAIAMGSGYRFNENVAVKMGVSMSAEGISSAMYNASVNVEW